MIYDQQRAKERFLGALALNPNVTLAARSAGLQSVSTAYGWRKHDPIFAEKWQWALEEAVDLLEAEAHRRAFAGTEEPVYYKGEVVGELVKYSDGLAQFLLSAHRPDKYRVRSEVNTNLSGHVTLTDTERLSRVKALLHLAAQRAANLEADGRDLL